MTTNKTQTTQPTTTGAPIYANRVSLVGYLGKMLDAKGNRAIFSVATKVSWKPKDSEAWQEATDWHRVVAWNGLAEVAGRLTPGDYVAVEGELRSSSYEREVSGQGVTLKTPIVSWEIHARSVRKLDRGVKAKANGQKSAKS
jgi:single-strand DNA-binding protein